MKHVGKIAAFFVLLACSFFLLFGVKMPVYAAENMEFAAQDSMESLTGQDGNQTEILTGNGESEKVHLPGNTEKANDYLLGNAKNTNDYLPGDADNPNDYLSENAENPIGLLTESGGDALEHLPENVPETLVGDPGDVVEVTSWLQKKRPEIMWDSETVEYNYVIVKITYSDLDGGNEQTVEDVPNFPEYGIYWFDDIVLENPECQYSYVVELYDEAGQLVGITSGGPFTFYTLNIILEFYDAEGNPADLPELDDFTTLGEIYMEGDDYADSLYFYEFPRACAYKDAEGYVEAFNVFSGFQYTETEMNGVINTDLKTEFYMDHDITITLRYTESANRIPIHLDTGTPFDDYPNFAEGLVDVLNETDELCQAELEEDGKTISLQIPEAQNGYDLYNYVKAALREYDFGLAWSTDVLLSMEKSYPSKRDYTHDNDEYTLSRKELTENMTYYIIWCETIDTINVTVDPPVAGSEVTNRSGVGPDGTIDTIQTNCPHIVPSAETAERIEVGGWWCVCMESDRHYEGTIEDGEECYIMFDLNPRFGYVVDRSTKFIMNGDEYSVGVIFGIYYAKASINAVSALPTFMTHSLTLNGMIGVNFFMDLPELEGVNYEDSYMEFSVSGSNGTLTTDEYDANATSSKGNYFGFTRYVTSIQMADTITATFHYGPGWTVTNTYSVAEYVQDFEEEKDDYNDATVNLIHALADYGHFVQPMLANARGWVLGEDHAVMPGYTESYSDDEIANVTEAVSGFAAKFNAAGSSIKAANMYLALDSSTTMFLKLTPADGYAGEVTYSVDGGTSENATVLDDGRFRIALPDITAPRLGRTYSIRIQASGEAALEISPLSYANIVLNSDKYLNDADMRNAMVSLYRYYSAAQEFKNNL